MAKIKTMINLTLEQKNYIKEQAEKHKISRSKVIGDLIDYEIFMMKGEIENAKNIKR